MKLHSKTTDRTGKRTRRGEMASREDGYILLAVLFLVAMVLLSLSAAAPKMAASIQRDRELELVHRGQQYVRAIKLYYKRFGAYPPTIDALEKTNEIRFLRKRYKDPMTGKDDWHLIHFGENKTPSYGFFGQPITGAGGAALAGVGPGGTGTPIMGAGGSGGSSGGPLFGGSQLGGTSSGTSTTNGTGTTTTGTTNTGTNGTGTDPNSNNGGNNTGTGTGSGTNPGSSTGTGTGDNSGSSSSSSFGSNSNPLTVGGLGIIGVESTKPKQGILIWKKMTHINEWEFWYDVQADRMMAVNIPQGGTTGNPTGQTGSPGFNGGTPPSSNNPTTPVPQSPQPEPQQPQQPQPQPQ